MNILTNYSKEKHLKFAFKITFSILAFCTLGITQNWEIINPVFNPPGNYNFYHVSFVDENNGWMAESFPSRIWHTDDGGYTWIQQTDSAYAWIGDLVFTDTLNGWARFKPVNTDSNYIWRTNDGGRSWDKFKSPPQIICIEFFNKLEGVAGGDSMYKTIDGGMTWKTQNVDLENAGSGIYDISFGDRLNGWAIGSSVVSDAGIILKTTDGGDNWEVIDSITTIIGNRAYFIDANHGGIAGLSAFYGGLVRITHDGGQSWINPDLSSAPWLNDIVLTDSNTCWVIGDYGFLLKTQDGGHNWEKIDLGTDESLKRIIFVNNGRVGYIFGSNNTIYKYQETTSVLYEDDPDVPLGINLEQNYPNPFNNKTIIQYKITRAGYVNLNIYDIMGKRVITLVDEYKQAARYEINWNGKDSFGKDIISGIYFYQLEIYPEKSVRKMIILR